MYRPPKLLQTIFPARIWRITVPDRSVFLTFDDGPHPEIKAWVLDFLKQQGIVATFFCVGENVQRYPDLYQRVLAEGHLTGNHTMNHVNGMKTTNKKFLKSIYDAQKLIGSNLFRPPYGRLSKRLDKTLSKQFKIIMWTWLSKDYNNTVSIDKIITASYKIRPGDILVFHDNIKTKDRLKQLLPPIVERLKSEKFVFRLIE